LVLWGTTTEVTLKGPGDGKGHRHHGGPKDSGTTTSTTGN